MRSDFKVWIRFLYFGCFCPRTATLYISRWFCSLQLKLARQNYIDQKIETFETFFVMQKKTRIQFEHRKIVLVKVKSSVIEISESVHWSRCCYTISFISVWNEIYWNPRKQSTKWHPVNIRYRKKLVQHIGELLVVLKSK